MIPIAVIFCVRRREKKRIITFQIVDLAGKGDQVDGDRTGEHQLSCKRVHARAAESLKRWRSASLPRYETPANGSAPARKTCLGIGAIQQLSAFSNMFPNHLDVEGIDMAKLNRVLTAILFLRDPDSHCRNRTPKHKRIDREVVMVATSIDLLNDAI